MGYAIIIILSIGALSFCIFYIVGRRNGYEVYSKDVVSFLFAYSLIVISLSFFYAGKPRAIDVYNGTTTLEITYRNGVPVDSTVVWKKKNR